MLGRKGELFALFLCGCVAENFSQAAAINCFPIFFTIATATCDKSGSIRRVIANVIFVEHIATAIVTYDGSF